MSGKNEQGFSLILAIFLMVVFALLLTALVRIETASNLISGAQVTAERALMAAQSGAEAGVYQIAPHGKSSSSSCFNHPITSPSLLGLAGCTVVAVCTRSPHGNNTDFLITSTGTCGQVARTVVVRVTQSHSKPPHNCNSPYNTCMNNSRKTHNSCTKNSQKTYNNCTKNLRKTYNSCTKNCKHGDSGGSCRTACNTTFNNGKMQCRTIFNNRSATCNTTFSNSKAQCKITLNSCRVPSPPSLSYWLEKLQ